MLFAILRGATGLLALLPNKNNEEDIYIQSPLHIFHDFMSYSNGVASAMLYKLGYRKVGKSTVRYSVPIPQKDILEL